jgi:hypothetical protein
MASRVNYKEPYYNLHVQRPGKVAKLWFFGKIDEVTSAARIMHKAGCPKDHIVFTDMTDTIVTIFF